MAALMAVMLVGMAALAVDLGGAFVTKREVAKRTDFAALAGGHGDNLPTPTTTGTCGYGARGSVSDQAVKDVAAYFGTQSTNSAVSAAQLVDCSTSNGEVLYGSFTYSSANSTGIVLSYDKTKLTVISPKSHVDFGFAEVLGFSSVDVGSVATVQVGSQSIATLPLYAFSGCDFGAQTIAQPNNGHAAADVLLSHGGETNASGITSLATNPATTPAQVPLDVAAPNDSLVINGSSFTGITKVGFFESGTSGAGPEPVTIDTTKFTISGGNKITIPAVDPAVTGVQSFWYVRVYNGTTNEWSAVTTGNGNNVTLAALPLRVGDPTLTCGQGSSAGNFGTLLLQHSQGPTGQAANIAYNIAVGLEHPLGIFPNAASNWLCTSSSTGAKLWPADGTNCTHTKTGLDLNAAQDGFINGVSGKPGLLTKTGAGTGCAQNGNPATRVFGSYTINNDTLSCFFTDDTTNVGDVDGATFTGAPVLSAAIYKSARFVRVPVLGVQPSSGGSNKYQIIGMRPGFITDQANAATRTTPATSTNGITGTSGNVASIQVVFINDGALPPPPDSGGALSAYAGGEKVLRMVN
jgi:hypothetical protein